MLLLLFLVGFVTGRAITRNESFDVGEGANDGKSSHMIPRITPANVSSSTDKGSLLDDDEEVIEIDDMLFSRSQWKQMERNHELLIQGNLTEGGVSAIVQHTREWSNLRKAFVDYEQVGNMVKWPGNTVYWYFLDESSYSPSDAREIRREINILDSYLKVVSCVRIKEDRNQPSAVKIVHPGRVECKSHLGAKMNTHQEMLLHPDCLKDNAIDHEFFHVFGFQHTHSRPDREFYVYIMEQNIKKNLLTNFDVREGFGFDIVKTPYEYGSLMHYNAFAGTKNGEMTLRSSLHAYDNTIGLRTITFLDLYALNKLYKCEMREICAYGGYQINKLNYCLCPWGYQSDDCRRSNADVRYRATKKEQQLKLIGHFFSTSIIFERPPGAKYVEISIKDVSFTMDDCKYPCRDHYIEIKDRDQRTTGKRICCPTNMYLPHFSSENPETAVIYRSTTHGRYLGTIKYYVSYW